MRRTTTGRPKGSGFFCQDCGHSFRTVAAAERASFGDRGCPKCGSSDVDLGNPRKASETKVRGER